MIGIDPGLSGGVTLLNLDGRHVDSRRLPTRAARKGRTPDMAELAALLRELQRSYDIRLVAVEEAQVMHAPGQGRKTQGVVSAFTSGRGFGKIEGCLEALGIPYELVPPKKWQQAVLGKVTSDKRVGIDYVKRRFPGVDLRPGRCARDQDWISDSTCIAEYGRRLVQGVGPRPGKKK